MVQFTLPQSPEILLNVPGKDSLKTRAKAMDQLIEMMDSGTLPTDLPDGFDPQQFIEVKEQPYTPSVEDDAIAEAVQTLSNLAKLKLKAQETRTEALQVREKIDILFSEEPISEDDITSLNDGFKVLKTYAQTNLRYREARTKAEEARSVLDRALNPTEAESKPPAKKAGLT
jgi:hypothetical protein